MYNLCRIILFLGLQFIVNNLFAQINNRDAFYNCTYDKEVIKRKKIKEITIQSYSQQRKTSLTTFIFDTMGILRQESVFDSSGKKLSDYFFEFNDKGDLVLRRSVSADLKKTDSAIFKRIYQGGKLLRELRTDLDFLTEYTYDHKNQMIKTQLWVSSNKVYALRRVKNNNYNAAGKLVGVKETVFNGDADTIGRLISDRIIRYKNNKIQRDEEQIKADSFIPINRGTTEYEYDKTGNLTAIKSVQSASRFYTFNMKGLIATEKVIMPEDFSSVIMNDKYSYRYWK